jgi:lysophospholipase L1-like esterase
MDRYRVGAAYLASLDRLLAGAARQGVPVLIVDLPVSADLDDRLYPAQFAAYRTALADAAAARGVAVLHATRAAVGLTDADFSDLVHLNGEGAAKMSAWLRTAITAAGEVAP